MNLSTEPMQHYRKNLVLARTWMPGREYPWLEKQRTQASEQFTRQSFPTRKDEAWRYTSVDSLLQHPFKPIDDVFTALQEEDIEEIALSQTDAYRLVFANGRLLSDLSRYDGLPAGVHILGLREALVRHPGMMAVRLGKAIPANTHIFMSLNRALFNDGCVVYIEAGCVLDKPVELFYLAVGLDESTLILPRNLLILEEGASATVVEHFATSGHSTYFNNTLTEIQLEQDAVLYHYRLQEESENAYHMSGLYLRQAGNSRYVGTNIALGGCWSRTDYNAGFNNTAGNSQINGLYIVGDGQLVDFHLNIEHTVPACSSRQKFKGVLLGRGRAVFDGRIKVAKDAQKTDAHLFNSNLLIAPDAEVDIKPQLEIYADDVKCSHGTAVAQLEPEQLFYLRSRGINVREAKKMLCLGFASEILDKCEVASLRERVDTVLRERIQGTFI